MKRLERVCPLKMQKLQTDNGTEYTYKFYKRYADVKEETVDKIDTKKAA